MTRKEWIDHWIEEDIRESRKLDSLFVRKDPMPGPRRLIMESTPLGPSSSRLRERFVGQDAVIKGGIPRSLDKA